jgi:arylformamidase
MIFKILFFLSMIISTNSQAAYWWDTEVPDYLQSSQLKFTDVIKDISYGSDIRQKFDIYVPRKKIINAPILFLVHGGAWMSGDKASARMVVNKVNYWSEKGFIVVSTGYRLAPHVSINTQFKDVIQAINRAQSMAHEWGGDKNKFILIGHSSGAHLLMLLKPEDILVKPKAIIGLDTAGFDISEIMSRHHQKFYDIAFSDKDKWKELSPINVASNFNYLLVCSEPSKLWCKQALKFSSQVIENGGIVKHINVKLNHNEVNEKLGENSSYTENVNDFIKNALN